MLFEWSIAKQDKHARARMRVWLHALVLAILVVLDPRSIETQSETKIAQEIHDNDIV